MLEPETVAVPLSVDVYDEDGVDVCDGVQLGVRDGVADADVLAALVRLDVTVEVNVTALVPVKGGDELAVALQG